MLLHFNSVPASTHLPPWNMQSELPLQASSLSFLHLSALGTPHFPLAVSYLQSASALHASGSEIFLHFSASLEISAHFFLSELYSQPSLRLHSDSFLIFLQTGSSG